jgi:peptidoglycan/xylan/chitin deacetylase (PgdA/CDA1 family)
MDYYAAVANRDCGRATALRPGYTADACLTITGARVLGLSPMRQVGDRAVLALRVELDKTDGTRQTFDGLVGLRRCGRQWYIPTWAFRGSGGEDFTERFLNGSLDQAEDFCNAAPPVPTASTAYAAAEPPPLPAPAALPAVTGAASGSSLLLKRCWSVADLAGPSSEAMVSPALTPEPRDAPRPQRPGRWTGRLQGPASNIRYVRPNSAARLVALTFNLIERPGEVSGYDAALVEALRAARAPATFFASGRWMQSHPERARQLMVDPLFELGSLGWDHHNMATLDDAETLRQWRLADAVYVRLRSGLTHRKCTADADGQRAMRYIPELPPLLRFPYGRCNDRALVVTASAAVPIVQWSTVLDDIAEGASVEAMRARVREDLERLGPGLIIVGHADGRGRYTAAALPRLLADLTEAGYRTVTVSTLLAAGEPERFAECFEHRPQDNLRYDDSFAD